MSRTKLLLDVVSDMRSLADSLETIANAVAGNDGISKEKQAEKYGVKNITAVAESDLDSFYADLQQMEVS